MKTHTTLSRDTEAAEIPYGGKMTLPSGTVIDTGADGAEQRLAHRAPQLRAAAAEASGLLEVARLLVLSRRSDRDAEGGGVSSHPASSRQQRMQNRAAT